MRKRASSVNWGNVIHVNRRHMDILDEEPIPEEQKLHIIHEPDMNQADTMTLMKTYFDNKFSTLKKQLKYEKDTFVEAKRHKNDIDFKYKSNKKQFEFNQDLCDNIEVTIKVIERRLSETTKNATKMPKEKKHTHSDSRQISMMLEYCGRMCFRWARDEKKIKSGWEESIGKTETTKIQLTKTSYIPSPSICYSDQATRYSNFREAYLLESAAVLPKKNCKTYVCRVAKDSTGDISAQIATQRSMGNNISSISTNKDKKF